jgi:hypothetical protein
MDPLWITVMYLFGRARSRTRSALNGNPESGALTLEWLVIAGVLVIAATGLTVWLTGKVKQWEGKVP